MKAYDCLQIGHWYQTADGSVFRIVDIKRESAVVSLEYVDGATGDVELGYITEIEPLPIPSADRRFYTYETFY